MAEIQAKQKLFYAFAWCANDEADFRNKTPLELMGGSLQKFGGVLGVRLVILEGIEKFSQEYLSRLRELGFDILDYCAEFKAIVERFPNINVHYSHYERNCFLRWIAFGEITFLENPESQVWHIDSDLVFLAPLEDIGRDTAGKTFMLQGCPAFVSIANSQWFEIYRDELQKLEEGIVEYSAEAALGKVHFGNNDLRLGNQSVYRNPLGSDQDLLEYLVGSEKISQTAAIDTLASKFCFLENPLSLRKLLPRENLSGERKFTDNQKGLLFYGEKPLPFVHYQGTFCFFANIYLCLVQWRLHRLKLWKRLLRFKTVNTKFKVSFTARVIWKIAKWRKIRFSKEKVIRLLTTRENAESPLPITELLNFINETEDIK